MWQPAARSFVAATSSEATIALAAYDLGGCVPWLALSCGALLQASLQGGPFQRFLGPLPDVQQLLALEPACTHILCVPFGVGPAGHWDQYACGHRRARGGLLLGLAAPPELLPGSLALLSGLGDALSAALAKSNPEVAALAEYVCGTWEIRCTCSDDSAESDPDSGSDGGEEEEDAEEDDGSRAAPCREDHAGGSGDTASGGWANVVPTTKQERYAHTSEGQEEEQPGPLGKARLADAGTKQQPRRSAPPSVHHAAKLAALPDSAGLASDPLWLAFADAGVEGQYRAWHRQERTVVEVFACLFTLLAAVVAGWGEPYRLAVRAPGGLAFAAGLSLLMVFSASPLGRRALPPGARAAWGHRGVLPTCPALASLPAVGLRCTPLQTRPSLSPSPSPRPPRRRLARGAGRGDAGCGDHALQVRGEGGICRCGRLGAGLEQLAGSVDGVRRTHPPRHGRGLPGAGRQRKGWLLAAHTHFLLVPGSNALSHQRLNANPLPLPRPQARIQMQAALQALKLAIAATGMPALCAVCFPAALASTCSALGVAGLTAAGFAAPLGLAWLLERADRRAFAGQVQRELQQY